MSGSETGDELIGATLDGRYQVLELIGRGAMGTVYRGERVHLHRTVAIKVLHDSLPNELAARRRFEQEALAMAKLEHPHCVTVLDVGMHDGRPYVVMELVSGESLRAVLDRGPIDVARATGIARQVLSGLAHAHELGIVHRDIKPANLMLGHKTGLGDHVKILDFGLARSLDPTNTRLTTGLVLGTPSYMSPEQCRDGGVDARSDLYAVGVVLYEMLTGFKPFWSDKDDPIEVVGMHMHKPAPRLAEKLPSGDFAALEPVVARALAKDPAERYPSASDLADAIESAVRGDTVPIERFDLESLDLHTPLPPAGPLLVADATPLPAPMSDATPSAPVDRAVVTTAVGFATVAAPPAPVTVPPAEPVAPFVAPYALPAKPAALPAEPAAQPAEPVAVPAEQAALPPDPLAATAGELVAPDPPTAAEPLPRPPSIVPPMEDGAPVESWSASADATEPVKRVGRQPWLIPAGGVAALLVIVIAARHCGSSSTPQTAAHVPAIDASGLSVTPLPTDAAMVVATPPPIDASAPADADTALPGADDPAGQALLAAGQKVSTGDIDGALKLLAQAHARYSANPDIPFMAGQLYFQKQRYHDGIASLRAAVDLFPGYRDDPEMAKLVVTAFLATPSRNAEIARFVHDLGDITKPLLRDAAVTDARAASELQRM